MPGKVKKKNKSIRMHRQAVNLLKQNGKMSFGWNGKTPLCRGMANVTTILALNIDFSHISRQSNFFHIGTKTFFFFVDSIEALVGLALNFLQFDLIFACQEHVEYISVLWRFVCACFHVSFFDEIQTRLMDATRYEKGK